MELASLIADPESLVAPMAGLSCFSAILVVSWPYLVRDNLGARMRQLADEREKIRLRERARLQSGKSQPLLRARPKKLYQAIVDLFDLDKQADDGGTAQLLRLAGYRGRGPIVAYLAARFIAPIAALAAAIAFTLIFLDPELSLAPKLAISLGAAWFACYLPLIFLKNRTAKRQTSIRRAWPEALDLMLICVESGMSVEGAIRKVSEEIASQSVELAEEMSLTTAELSYLQDRRKAFENLAARTGLDGVKAVVTSLIQAEKYGTPVGQALRVLAQENRDMRMSEAEKRAASLPPKLTVPMIVFFLPVLFAIIMTPAAIQIINAQ